MNTDHEENLILHSLNAQLLRDIEDLKFKDSQWRVTVEDLDDLMKQRDDALAELDARKAETAEALDQKKMMQETFSKGFDTWAGYWKVKATTLAEDLDKAQRDRFELAGQVEARDVEINRLAHANITTHDEVAGFLDEIHDLKEVTEIKCRLIGTLHAEIDRVRGEWRVAHEANDRHIKLIQDLEHRLAKAEAINISCRKYHDEKRVEIYDLKEDSEMKSRLIKSLHEDLDQLRQENGRIRQMSASHCQTNDLMVQQHLEQLLQVQELKKSFARGNPEANSPAGI